MIDVLDDAGRPLDQVALQGLRVRGRHGVLAAERELGQEFVVDLVLHLDTRPAARSDDLSRTVDYGRLAERVAAVVAGEPVDLLETLAQRIADVVLAAGGSAPVDVVAVDVVAVDVVATEVVAVEVVAVDVVAVDVSVHKPQAPVPVPFGDVTVRIRRWRG
jgi:7,8-dihydroneopterin aldolase/epimerase/oxygenase